ncbi:hypothetical protein [Nitrospira lenta]|uniref:Lipoprotein n=1 Tax=Nitrospira lenta TaxID=1436998 RepID=A0A330L801_9BACT|nr:hypothetical protein [Nitrospira lenta]SPP65812.1 conserved exported hypothetical protein [Nitrospira lenta]
MHNLVRGASLLTVYVLVVACASAVPPSRMGQYLKLDQPSAPEALLKTEPRPLTAGLVLVRDQPDQTTEAVLPEEALVRLGETLKQDVARVLPLTVTAVLSAEGVRPQDRGGDLTRLVELAKSTGLEYLAVVVVSSAEQEYPVTLFLGWTTHAQPGYRRDNWSLLEFALIEVTSGRVVMQAEGRGSATLDRPTAPGMNQWYPVVYLRPQEPERRIWPPTYEGAPNTLRVVSFEQAEKRLALKLQNSWLGQLEADAAARRSS